MDEATDEELMGRVQHRDRDAFAVLVARHLDGIHAFNYRMTGNAEDAADLAQETFLRVWQRAATWRPDRPAGGSVKFTTWLYRIARNLAIDTHRRQRESGEVNDNVADGGGTPEDAQTTARLRHALDDALVRLPERQRTALVLCHRDGMSNRNAAAVLEVSVDALESLLARARRTLRLKLREYR